MVVLMAVFTASASAALPANGTFEGSGSGSLSNWKGTNATLSLVAGHDGNWAARASLSAAATSYSLVASPRPVTSTVKDAVYSSTAWVRSQTPGKSVCLKLAEYNSSGSTVGQAQNCLTTTAGWQQFPTVQYTAAASGDSLAILFTQGQAVAGNSFDIDTVELTVTGDGAPPPGAGVCTTKKVLTTTSTLCITAIKPENGTPVFPSPGQTVNVSGNTLVTATITYSPGSTPAGETRGCGGERLTPSGCMTFYVNGVYTLTRLYYNSQDSTADAKTSTYSFVWGTSQYANGGRTLSAQINNNGTAVQTNVPVQISNGSPGVFHSPIPNNGRLPSFVQGGQTGGFTVVALGDGPAGSTQTAAVANLVHSWNPDMLMYLGDVYQRGMKDEFMNFYDPLYGADWAKTVPTIGNHEYKQVTDGSGYFWYWNYPKNSPTVAGGGGGWYSLNAAGWHIINLNSNVGMTLSNPATEQGTWLQSDLAADKAARPPSGKPCTLAFWHAARFSDISLRKPATSSFWNQLYPYHADVIVNAHSHVYERWTNLSNSGGKATTTNGIPAGITEFVSGTGGNVLAQSWQTNNPNSDFRQNTQWGALKLTLYPNRAHFEYWTAKTGANTSTLLDSGDILCH